METNRTIFTVVANAYIYECNITAVTELSIVAKNKDFCIETLHSISDKNKKWFETREGADEYIARQKEITKKIEELKKELA